MVNFTDRLSTQQLALVPRMFTRKERSAKISENKWLQVVCVCMCDVCDSGITTIGGILGEGWEHLPTPAICLRYFYFK